MRWRLLTPQSVYRRTCSFGTRRLSTVEVRKAFVQYYEDYDHVHVPSSSLVPDERDRSLMFTNAGMNQFKSIFLGSTDNRWSFLERAVNYQKCIRAGGKHNDLDDVGKDGHHLTFFEMLGSWSFNNGYSKEAACHLAWNFLVDKMRIDPSRLYVSYFAGNDQVPADTKCRDIWLKIGVPESHVLPFESENFWEMGSVGPCGPCTEIHYDRIEGRQNAGHLVNRDESIVELWNLVFMSLNRLSNGRLDSLPSMHIDTGMGLERLVSVVQSVHSNFDTDAFQPIIKATEQLSSCSSGKYTGVYDPSSAVSFQRDSAYRIVADHVRAVTMAVADGVAPAGTGAGFVVRKMLRRAFWQSAKHLEMDRGAIGDLVRVVADTLSPAYGNLTTAWESVQQTVVAEEKQYWKLMDKGERVLNDIVLRMPEGATQLSGKDAWYLQDTHGVPLEMTRDLLSKKGLREGLTVDEKGYEEMREKAKRESTRASSFTHDIWLDPSEFPTHSSSAKYDYTFSRETDKYVFPTVDARLLGLWSVGSSARVSTLSGEGSLVLDRCQFYAEQGGQKVDWGTLTADGVPVFNVSSVKIINGITVLQGTTIDGAELSEDMLITQHIDQQRRLGLMRAHTATHLIHWALRGLGAARGQRGSSVDDDSFRFDYATGDTAAEDGTIIMAESLIGDAIARYLPVSRVQMPLERAQELFRLQSEFREDKEYPSEVTVSFVGGPLEGDEAIAVECCSGTHVLDTSHVIDVCVMSDRSSAKGVRRLTAVTGRKAQKAREYGKSLLERLERMKRRPVLKAEVPQIKKTIDWSLVPYVDVGPINESLLYFKPKAKVPEVKKRPREGQPSWEVY